MVPPADRGSGFDDLNTNPDLDRHNPNYIKAIRDPEQNPNLSRLGLGSGSPNRDPWDPQGFGVVAKPGLETLL
uniref:Uncharacterized protein n=1 Tax=Romanomermis culicivorax TaxID=13658 RepID=A0A915IK97_ROMCU